MHYGQAVTPNDYKAVRKDYFCGLNLSEKQLGLGVEILMFFRIMHSRKDSNLAIEMVYGKETWLASMLPRVIVQ